MPENGFGIKRESLLCISDFIYWIYKNKPELYKDAIRAVGNNCREAFNDLDVHIDLWR